MRGPDSGLSVTRLLSCSMNRQSSSSLGGGAEGGGKGAAFISGFFLSGENPRLFRLLLLNIACTPVVHARRLTIGAPVCLAEAALQMARHSCTQLVRRPVS